MQTLDTWKRTQKKNMDRRLTSRAKRRHRLRTIPKFRLKMADRPTEIHKVPTTKIVPIGVVQGMMALMKSKMTKQPGNRGA